ncbi:hypothetical protein AI2791V1_4418 [Klebsiella pneumoniae]|nr:hypothetical protein AI2791V1_4418 [Klebsiella pneumoniae]CAH3903620.1 hypothetical protein AI2791V1_4418 [Klebsiella pneumoniae]
MGWFIVVRSRPSRDCPGGIWGWITPSKDDVATGYTITPGKEFNLTMKDMCSPDMKVTFRPNKKDPRYDDLVGIGNDSNLLIVFYVQIMPDDFVMQLHRF